MKLTNIIRRHKDDRTVGRSTVRQRGLILFNRLAIYCNSLYSRGYVFHKLAWHKV